VSLSEFLIANNTPALTKIPHPLFLIWGIQESCWLFRDVECYNVLYSLGAAKRSAHMMTAGQQLRGRYTTDDAPSPPIAVGDARAAIESALRAFYKSSGRTNSQNDREGIKLEGISETCGQLRDVVATGETACQARGLRLARRRRERDYSFGLSAGALQERKAALEQTLRVNRSLLWGSSSSVFRTLFAESEEEGAVQKGEEWGHIHIALDGLAALSSMMRHAAANFSRGQEDDFAPGGSATRQISLSLDPALSPECLVSWAAQSAGVCVEPSSPMRDTRLPAEDDARLFTRMSRILCLQNACWDVSEADRGDTTS